MEKTPDFDYTKVPNGYVHASECLRHLTGLNIPADVQTVRCVSPSAWPTAADVSYRQQL